MTTFGKLVMGLLLAVVGTGVFYGVSSYVKSDVEPIVTEQPLPEISGAATTTSEDLLNGTSTSTTTPATKKMAFSRFIKEGGSYKCSVSLPSEEQETKGVVYLYNKMIRGVFTSSTSELEMVTNMIVRDGYSYMWNNMVVGVGYKIKVGGAASSTMSMLENRAWDPDQIGDYSCEEWKGLEASFELPKSVKFTE